MAQKKDYKQMNEEYALHNMNCDDKKDYKYVEVSNSVWDNNSVLEKKAPILFFKDGRVRTTDGNYWDHWKEIEEPKKRPMTCKELIDAGVAYMFHGAGRVIIVDILDDKIYYASTIWPGHITIDFAIEKGYTWSDYTGKQRNSFEVDV